MNKEFIESILIKIGVPIRLNGYKFIVDTIQLLDQPEWNNPKWSALYNCVATINYTTPKAVEKAIRKALQNTRDNCADYDAINHYIGFSYTDNSNSLMQLYKVAKSEFVCDNEQYIFNLFKLALNQILNERAM